MKDCTKTSPLPRMLPSLHAHVLSGYFVAIVNPFRLEATVNDSQGGPSFSATRLETIDKRLRRGVGARLSQS